ncbi:MAG: Fur family transcriptional regulator, partial [Chloroflexota bacterium]
CVTARELAASLHGGARPVGLATVYRSLSALEEAGLVHAVDLGGGERHYELVHDDGTHHHHVVCERCGRTTEIDDRGVRDIVRSVERRTGFRIDSHRLELFGRCPACASA